MSPFSRNGGAGRLALQRALDAVPTAILVLTGKDAVAFANTAAAHTFGVDAGDAEGRPASDFIDLTLRGPTTRGTRSSGDRFTATIDLTPLGPGDAPAVLAVITDLSEDRRGEGRLRSFLLAAPTAMVLAKASGAIVLSNAAAQLLFDYSSQELAEMSVDQLVPDRVRPHHRGLREDFADNPDRPDMSTVAGLRGRGRDGTEIPVAISLSPVQFAGEDHILAAVVDLTAQHREQALAAAVEAHRLHADMLGCLSFSVVAVGIDGLISSANPAALRLLGYGRDQLVGVPFVSIHERDELRRLAVDVGQFRGRRSAVGFELFHHLTRGGLTDDRDLTYVRRDGSTVAVNQVFTAMRDQTGRLHGYLVVAHDISRRREAEDHVAHMATHDELTGLPNRTTLVGRIDSLIASAAYESFTVVMFDIDHFGRVNEAFGHRAGDEMLAALAHRLKLLAPVQHLIARVGGDKFAFVLIDVSGGDIESIVSSTVRDLLEPVGVSSHDVRLGASIGAALFPRDAVDATALVKSADAAVTGAKSEGRGSMCWFNAAAHHEVSRSLRLQAALPLAIENGEIAMHYQPIMSLATGLILGVEALARWTSPVFGSVPPSQFIPIAEEDGTILRLGEWSLRRSCADIAALQRKLGRDLTLAVNVSPHQFRGQAWADIVADTLAESGLASRRLELEITENIFIAHPHEAIEAIVAVQSQGVSVVLDDFGTGYSSFSYLTRFPLDKIKIDRSFVGRLVAGGADAAVVEAIIAMAHTLGMTVVAEGVELASQAAFLNRHGCDEAQGYLYSPAVPFDELAALVGALDLVAEAGEP